MSNLNFFAMKTLLLLAALLTFGQLAHAVDTTPPTLDITHTWIEKRPYYDGKTYSWFSMYLDPRDETGMAVDNILFRSALNTSTIPATGPSSQWNWMPWTRGERFEIGFICTSCVIEIRARDAAGNLSPIQKRYFASPFPYSPAPNLTPQLIPMDRFTGSAGSLRGLFVGRFDGVGTGDDLLEVDRATGNIMVRRMINNQPSQSDVSFTVAPNTIYDSASADFDTDSRADLAIIAANVLTVYHNDGLDGSGVVQFGAQTISTGNTAITEFSNIAVGDITGDGKLDIIVSGYDSGGAARIGWLIANATWQYDSSAGVPVPAGATPGKLAVGDMNGDGLLDVVMVDAAQNQMIVFKNKGTELAGDGEVDVNFQPVLIPTGLGQAGPNPVIPLIAAPVKALAVGDVTGDGRADILTVFSELLYSNPFDSNDGRTQQRWRLYANIGTNGFRPFTDLKLGESATSQSVVDNIPSDVLLQDLNNDRFPELLFTNYYGNSVKIIRFTPLLDNQNFLTTLDDGTGNPELDEQDYVPIVSSGPAPAGPSRLARGKLLTSSGINSIAMAFSGSDSVCWEMNVTRASSKTYDIQGGAFTDSDPNGTDGANGIKQYDAHSGEKISYSLTCINNSATDLTGVFMDCTMPANVSLITDTTDAGWFYATVSGVKNIRWTVNVPANSALVKNFNVRILSGKVGSTITPTCNLRQGTTVKASAPMPKITIREPIDLKVTAVSDFDPQAGQRVHAEEKITYLVKMTNRGATTQSGCKLSLTIPTNTFYSTSDGDILLGVPTVRTPATGKVVSVSWANFDLAPGAIKTVEVGVIVNAGVGIDSATPVSILCNKVVFTRADGTAQTANSWQTEVKPQLEMDLLTNENVVRPGQDVTCTFTIHNYGSQSVNNAKVVYLLPPGCTLVDVYTPDDADAPDGKGNFDVGPPLPLSQLHTITNPTFDAASRIITWTLGRVPGGGSAARRLKFTVQVQYDLASHYYTGGQYNGVNVVNNSYNFVASNSSGKRLFAAQPPVVSPATQINAASKFLLSTKVPARTLQISDDDPITPPRLTLLKTASADGKTLYGMREIPTVVNDASVTTDGLVTYGLQWDNTIDIVNGPVPGTARQVVIRDYIPTNTVFKGYITRNFAPVSNSFLGFKFYDSADKEIPNTPTTYKEAFTDSNGSGFWETGEAYVDANNNKKYDGLTTALIRSIGFPVGDVPGHQSGIFHYRTQTTSSDGFLIESLPALLQKTGVLTFTLTRGYHMTASNLLFPVPSANVPVQVLVTRPATIKIPSGVVVSRDEIVGTEMTEVGFIVEVSGGAGLGLSGMKATIPIPAAMQVFGAEMYNLAGNLIGSGTVNTLSTALARTLTFDLGSQRDATVKFKVAVDPANVAKLRNNATPAGYTTAPLSIKPTVSGKYTLAAPPPPAPAKLKYLAAAAQPPPPPKDLASAIDFNSVPVLSNPAADSKIFIGRLAPATVKRGGTFSYTIIIGNLTDQSLNSGTITMKVPVGCTAVSAQRYGFNALSFIGAEISGSGIGAFTPVPTDKNKDTAPRGIVWSTPQKAGTTIKLDIFSLLGSEAGAMQVTMKVDDNFKGNRIDDASCIFDAPNASGKWAGPLGVVVRDGNEITDYASTVQLIMEGLGAQYNQQVRDAMTTSLQLNNESSIFTTGGCQMLQVLNGVNVIKMTNDRVLVIGPSDRVSAPAGRLVLDGPMRVAVGPGNVASGISLTKIPFQVPGAAFSPNQLLISATLPNGIVAAGGGNIVAGGGGNIVAAGGGNLTAQNVVMIPPEGADAVAIIDIGAHLIGDDGASIVAAGGGNIVAAGGGNIVAAGGGNIVAAGGGNVKDPLGIVAAGGGNIVAAGGGNIVAAGGGNIVAAGGGNIVAAGGGNLAPANFK